MLGALFRSRDLLNDETELVVVVTPYCRSYGSAGLPRSGPWLCHGD